MKYCPHCRKPTSSSRGACPHCGEDLDTGAPNLVGSAHTPIPGNDIGVKWPQPSLPGFADTPEPSSPESDESPEMSDDEYWAALGDGSDDDAEGFGGLIPVAEDDEQTLTEPKRKDLLIIDDVRERVDRKEEEPSDQDEDGPQEDEWNGDADEGRALYSSGRRAGLIEAAQILRWAIEEEGVSLTDFKTLEEILYSRAGVTKASEEE